MGRYRTLVSNELWMLLRWEETWLRTNRSRLLWGVGCREGLRLMIPNPFMFSRKK